MENGEGLEKTDCAIFAQSPAKPGGIQWKPLITITLLAGEPVSRILSSGPFARRMVHRGDHSSSPGIATGIQQPTRGFSFTIAFAIAKGAHFRKKMGSASRAGSPLLFGLAPRGVFRASDVTIGAVGSYPTFSPLPNVACISASLRFPCATATVLRPPAVYSLWHSP